jgi:hypothetical protein
LDVLRSCEPLLGFEGPRVSRRQALRKVAWLGAGIAGDPIHHGPFSRNGCQHRVR